MSIRRRYADRSPPPLLDADAAAATLRAELSSNSFAFAA